MPADWILDPRGATPANRWSVTCAFCAISRGDAPAAVVHETPELMVFLDHSPLFLGHCLVIPREHRETLPDLPVQQVGDYFLLVRELAATLPRALGCGGSFVAMNNRVSQSVPHLHTHVVPRTRGDGLRGFFWPRKRYASPEQMREFADRIRNELTP